MPSPADGGENLLPAFFKRLSPALLALACLVALGCAGCAKKAAVTMPPLPRVAMAETEEFFVSGLFPTNQELGSWKEMGPALRKSLEYVQRKDPGAVAVSRKGLRVTWGELADTLRELRAVLPELDRSPRLLLERFRWVRVDQGISYSGYYEPTVRASRTRTEQCSQPIYALPPDLDRHRRRHGRYYTRRDIDGPRQVLAGRGLELAWADPVDVFFMQIQGHGKLVFDDDTTAYVCYAGQNGHKYVASGRIIVRSGHRLKRGDVIEQKEWLRKNRKHMWDILFQNPSYVFFRFSARGALGAMNSRLDDWLSLATDRDFLPLGSVLAFGVNIPDPEKGSVSLRGIGFAQDTGGAIRRNRIDLYCGGSERANYVASKLDARGPCWVLLKKGAPAKTPPDGTKQRGAP